MADNSNQLILDALHRAVADPAGIALHGGKTSGLFSTSASAKKAAQLCLAEGYVRTIRTEIKGKSTHAICAITDKGLAFLLGQLNPKEVLASLVNALEARKTQLAELVDSARVTQAGFEALKNTAEKILHHVERKPATALPCDKTALNGNASDIRTSAIVSELTRWQASGALEDCPLPGLYRIVHEAESSLTIGQFHDALRRLHERTRVYLHPWTGPMFEIPEPEFALMVGHEIAYYVSLRSS